MILCSILRNGLCKIVTKSQIVTKFNVTESKLHCILLGLKTKVFLYKKQLNDENHGQCRFAQNYNATTERITTHCGTSTWV